jgi:hypothetical protein
MAPRKERFVRVGDAATIDNELPIYLQSQRRNSAMASVYALRRAIDVLVISRNAGAVAAEYSAAVTGGEVAAARAALKERVAREWNLPRETATTASSTAGGIGSSCQAECSGVDNSCRGEHADAGVAARQTQGDVGVQLIVAGSVVDEQQRCEQCQFVCLFGTVTGQARHNGVVRKIVGGKTTSKRSLHNCHHICNNNSSSNSSNDNGNNYTCNNRKGDSVETADKHIAKFGGC